MTHGRLRLLVHVLWMTPAAIWVAHFFVVYPILDNTNAEGQLSIWMFLLLTAGPVMLAAEVIAISVLMRDKTAPRLPLYAAMLLNATPLYYLKVIVGGLSVNRYF